MEHGPFIDDLPSRMVIFHSFASLAEGMSEFIDFRFCFLRRILEHFLRIELVWIVAAIRNRILFRVYVVRFRAD